MEIQRTVFANTDAKGSVARLKERVLPLFLRAKQRNVFLNVDLEQFSLSRITYDLFELNPLGYHLGNLLLHSGSVVLMFLVLRQLLGMITLRVIKDTGLRDESLPLITLAALSCHTECREAGTAR